MRKWLTGGVLCCVAVALAACGSSGTPAGEENVEATPTSVATGPLLDGTYLLTGTQECKSAQGGGTTSFAIFDGSTLVVAGNQATVTLRNEPLEAPVTTDGNTFHIYQAFDSEGPVGTGAGQPPSSVLYVLELTGTSTDGGLTIIGTGGDGGVNCQYTFTGHWNDGSSSTLVPTVADPCTVADPATGEIFEHWSHFDPSLGEVRVVSACAEPWARTNFEHGNDSLVHWNGSSWEIADPAEYCATTAMPGGAPTEDNQAARIYYSTCSPAAQPAPSTTSEAATASAGPCTTEAIQAALPAGQEVLSDPECDGGWATTDVLISEENEILVLFRWNGSAWQQADRWLECGNGNVPASLYNLICLPTD